MAVSAYEWRADYQKSLFVSGLKWGMTKQEEPWYLYMVRTAKGVLYTGITKDVERRFAEHQSGGPKAAKALKGKGPLTLAYVESVGSKVDAYKREFAVKRLKKAAKERMVVSYSADSIKR